MTPLMPTSSGLETETGPFRPCSSRAPTFILCGLASSSLGCATMGAPQWNLEFQQSTFAGTYLEHQLPTTSESSMSPQRCILELRAISGLTWKELATLFRVSQRTMHSWANGENASAGHDTRIRDVLERVRRIHDGNAKATAYRLRSPHGEQPLLSAIADLPLSELTPTSVPAQVTRPSRTDGSRRLANWNPTPPFRDRQDEQPPAEEIKPAGEYPTWIPKLPPKLDA